MSAVAASISALKRLREEFAQGAADFPDLYYAIIHGPAVQNGGVCFPQQDGDYRSFEDYLKDYITEWKPWGDCVGCKYPRYFFFGNDVAKGSRELAVRCQIANKVVRDGLRIVSNSGRIDLLVGDQLPEHSHLLGESLFEHEWMHWMMYLGERTNDPLLKAQYSPFRIVDNGLPPTTIFVPTMRGAVGLHPFREDGGGIVPEFQDAWDLVRDGSLEGVTIFDTPVFYSSTVMIEHLMEIATGGGGAMLSEHQREVLLALLQLKAFDSDSRATTETTAGKAAGPRADPEAFKAPVSGLKQLGLVGSKEGRGGGIWLTPPGKARALALDKL
jgi:hypothetical protein